MAGSPCVTSVHRDFIPDAAEGAGSQAPAGFGLSGIKDLPGAGPAGGLECEKC